MSVVRRSGRYVIACRPDGNTTIQFSRALGGFTANTGVYADPSSAVSTLTININGFKRKVT